MAAETKRRLGRGLDALLGAYPGETPEPRPAGGGEAGRRIVPIGLIDRNQRNPRRDFRDEDLQELAGSLRRHGIVQPIVVRPIDGAGERYEIIAGERRWRAAQLAGLHEVPVTVLDVSEREALELAIVENVQRTDLNPVEEARGYQALIEEYDYSQADLGETIGKSRVHVTNTLRLLKLPPAVLQMLEAGTLSAGHGRALLGAADPGRLAKVIAAKGLSVREAERMAQAPDDLPRAKAKGGAAKAKSADVVALEKELTNQIGMKVEIIDDGEGRGRLTVLYRSLEQLDLICRRIRS
ncbi:MAG TPA: ParB/RepB/Spo0J family partition protein [Propylenella sp.]